MLRIGSALVLTVMLGGCYEGASTYDEKSGHYIGTDNYKIRYGVDKVCQTESCFDEKSGHFISGDEWNRRQRGRNGR